MYVIYCHNMKQTLKDYQINQMESTPVWDDMYESLYDEDVTAYRSRCVGWQSSQCC